MSRENLSYEKEKQENREKQRDLPAEAAGYDIPGNRREVWHIHLQGEADIGGMA